MYRYLCLFLLCSLAFAQNNVHEKKDLESKVLTGHVAMGPNHFMGKPIVDLGPPYGPVNLYSVGLYNPLGSDPIHVTADMEIEHPYSAILATIVDPLWAAFGSPTDFPQEQLNVPLHEVPVVLDGVGDASGVLTGPHTSGQLEPYRAYPYGPITLGQWQEAHGTATLNCLSNGGAELIIEVGGMLPNSVYTVWGIFAGNPIPLTPLGGIPNIIATDENGVNRFKRELNFCPMHPKEGDSRMLWISVAFHSDHSVFGNVPVPHNWPEGIIHHTQLQFFPDATVIDHNDDGNNDGAGGNGGYIPQFKK